MNKAYYLPYSQEFLAHHGIKGQKWGVRRYQNKDGSLTDEGRERQYRQTRINRELKKIDDVNAVVDTLSADEKHLLGMRKDDKKWISDEEAVEKAAEIIKTFIQRHGDMPVSMIEVWDLGDGKGDITIATNPAFRGKGYTSKNIQEMTAWFNSARNKKLSDLQWNNLKENKKSGQIAEKHGFGELETDDLWEYRVMRKKKG